MACGFYRRSRTAGGTAGVFQVGGVKELAAGFALIAPRVSGAAVGAATPDEAVSQETPAFSAVQLLDGSLGNEAGGVKFFEYILGYLGLYGGRGAPELVK